ncbi:MotA/TolQ/ExbB proton channel family protein [Quatrionicoccus australiensis]|uniref:MotA/TolQ/ExbB proton channel family protein n=1 Tax=Quatrionicoccus australiensis TaxID=138118 RepID=UPI00299DB8D6|nr:MotA/TolQ/ExbB proton channel family protein [Quatrionicoccus australiensis]UCV16150.1 MotA/TolQ/ExbB proton channel family protein [Quatrionicoccus australiensis]
MQDMNPIEYFFAHTDTLGAILFCLLFLMSLISWFAILSKAFLFWRIGRWAREFRAEFRPQHVPQIPGRVAGNPFSRLALASFQVHGELERAPEGHGEDLLLRCMSRIVGEEGARLDNGQTLLASIAAVAPFIGLFGTVWGVHNALAAIGAEGAASLELIAGPVGEALIMTALGLAVAIPAVLAYNVFSRSSQVLLAQLDALAHDLYHFLLTGRVLPDKVREF